MAVLKVPRRFAPRNISLSDKIAFFSRKHDAGCILWIGTKSTTGYGLMRWGPKKELAHRLAWKAANGEIPTGMLVLHHCDTPTCVNPEHLFIGTNADNSDDKVRKGRHAHGESHSRALRARKMPAKG